MMSRKSIRNEFEDAKLRLEILKENFEYIKMIEQAGEDLNSIKSFLKNECFIRTSWLVKDFENTKNLINPFKNIDNIPLNIQENILPTIFNEPAIRQIILRKSDSNEYPAKAFPISQKDYKDIQNSWRQYMFTCFSMLPEHERVIKIDLRKKPKQIKREFKGFLDSIYKKAADLKPDTSRARQEVLRHLEIWKLRRQKIGFRDISTLLDVPIDSVKKGFYRAYEIIQGKKYDKEFFKKLRRVKKSDMKDLCEICPQKSNCKELCPDALRFVNQDYVKIDYHEKLL